MADVEKTCKHCQTTFWAKSWTPRLYCSRSCSSQNTGKASATKGLETQKRNGTIIDNKNTSKLYARVSPEIRRK